MKSALHSFSSCLVAWVLIFDLLTCVATQDSCPAGSDPASCTPGHGIPDQDLRCVRWRQTGGCLASGPREAHGDLPCDHPIETGRSGYCECGSGRKARQVTCSHRQFTCTTACKQLRRYACVAWRQTGGCDADGTREPNNDKPCSEMIANTMSGYCECGDGRIIKKSGCEFGANQESFRCLDECAAEADLYEELGVEASASDKTLKQAFRKLSLKFHPDKTRNDPTASDRFLSIREAYDIVSDPEMRGLYDSMGIQYVYQAKGQKIEKGQSIQMEIGMTLEQLYNGEETHTEFARKVICKGCKERPSQRCNQCNAGCAHEIQLVQVQMGPFLTQQQQRVPSQQRCRHERTRLDISIEPGTMDGDSIVFKGKGEHMPAMIPGDVILKVKEQKHKFWKRKGVNLHTTIEISVKEALLGFERSVTQLDGRTISISVHGITPPKGVIRIEGEGMPHKGDSSQKGDLFVKCNYKMPQPEDLDAAKRKWIQENLP
eukprot:TRINITY_DN620_c1_g1_i1.p1 TRINITY_DN620_c1_g1~~TRINITY_DN620_c1_g1_i1.p1  ORF type:complete len:489 (+),score=92.81 TRINITY_DN620_c1_g1_i1:50-1516(+)